MKCPVGLASHRSSPPPGMSPWFVFLQTCVCVCVCVRAWATRCDWLIVRWHRRMGSAGGLQAPRPSLRRELITPTWLLTASVIRAAMPDGAEMRRDRQQHQWSLVTAPPTQWCYNLQYIHLGWAVKKKKPLITFNNLRCKNYIGFLSFLMTAICYVTYMYIHFSCILCRSIDLSVALAMCSISQPGSEMNARTQPHRVPYMAHMITYMCALLTLAHLRAFFSKYEYVGLDVGAVRWKAQWFTLYSDGQSHRCNETGRGTHQGEARRYHWGSPDKSKQPRVVLIDCRF